MISAGDDWFRCQMKETSSAGCLFMLSIWINSSLNTSYFGRQKGILKANWKEAFYTWCQVNFRPGRTIIRFVLKKSNRGNVYKSSHFEVVCRAEVKRNLQISLRLFNAFCCATFNSQNCHECTSRIKRNWTYELIFTVESTHLPTTLAPGLKSSSLAIYGLHVL